MALEKQSQKFNFAQGLETFTDPTQLAIGRFTVLENMVFVKNGNYGALSKRNSFTRLTSTPDTTSVLATLNGNLLSLGKTLYAYNQSVNNWLSIGPYQGLRLDTLAAVRNGNSQDSIDAAVAPNKLCALAYYDNSVSPAYKYCLLDSETGQFITQPQALPVTTGSSTFGARVYYLNGRFVFVHDSTVGAASQVNYFTIDVQTLSSTSVQAVSSSYSLPNPGYFQSGIVNSNTLYVGLASNQATMVFSISSAFQASAVQTVASQGSRLVTTAFDTSTNFVWTAGVLGASPFTNVGYAASDTGLTLQRSFQATVSSGSIGSVTTLALTSYAQNGKFTVLSELQYYYQFPGSQAAQEDFINAMVVSSGAATTQSTLFRGASLTAQAYLYNSQPYYGIGYQNSAYQNTNFLVGSGHQIAAKWAYGNAGARSSLSPLPQASVVGSQASMPYLIKTVIANPNKITANNLSSTTQTVGIYGATGINLARFTYTTSFVQPKEISQTLQVNGGFLWTYDGQQMVENNFFLYPDNLRVVSSSMGGSMSPQQYFYQVTYEWTDQKGNIYYSAPSVPQSVTVNSGTSQVQLYIPFYRLTYKDQKDLSIGVYRWSQASPVYYKISTAYAQAPLVNSIDHLVVVDSATDSAIQGNQILYTNGGVLEDSNGPASNAMTVWDSRLWMVDAEDPNTLWYSKSAVEATPLEMSTLQTFYVEPNAGAQGPTGPITALAPMDDKLVIFKKNAIYYVAGQGPDDTGQNSSYSEPVFITGTVGCTNPQSIVQTPMGLMFQSDKGIWMLKRDISTDYIGKDVEGYNQRQVISTINVPGTNQIRFDLNALGSTTGESLVYDYFVGQWSVFTNIFSQSSTLYQNLHTYVDRDGLIFRESPGSYSDGGHSWDSGDQPVVMRFQTGWIDMAGLQGYQRAYSVYLLGQWKSPHTLTAQVAYNYNSSVAQTAQIVPDNTSSASLSKEQWQINFQTQQIQSFQLTVSEVSSGRSAWGAGILANGLNLVYGVKKGWPKNIGATNKTG